MLLHIDGEIVEIRPGELFESAKVVESRYLEIISSPPKPKARASKKNKVEDVDGTES